MAKLNASDTMETLAAVARQHKQPLSVEPVRLSSLRSDEVRVELTATGVCHTDLAVIDGYFPAALPLVLGHEGSGVVVEAGSDVTDLEPGDHVVLTFDSCGRCGNCTSGHPVYCNSFAALNFSGRRPDGSPTITDAAGAPLNACFFAQSSFSRTVIARRRNAIKVRRDAPLELLGPLGCGFQTGAGTVLNVVRPAQDATIAIFGAGAVGFAALFAARIMGCERVVAVDRVPARLALAQELGAMEVIDTRTDELAARLAALGGVDVVIETTGVPALATAGVRALKPRGVCVIIGAGADPDMTIPMSFMIPGRTVMGVRIGDSDPSRLIPRLVDQLLEGRFPVDRLSRFYPFSSINEAIADTRSGESIKAILRF